MKMVKEMEKCRRQPLNGNYWAEETRKMMNLEVELSVSYDRDEFGHLLTCLE
jgi:hypothetical protein